MVNGIRKNPRVLDLLRVWPVPKTRDYRESYLLTAERLRDAHAAHNLICSRHNYQ